MGLSFPIFNMKGEEVKVSSADVTNHTLHGSSSGKDGIEVLQLEVWNWAQPSVLHHLFLVKAQRLSGRKLWLVQLCDLHSPIHCRAFSPRTQCPPPSTCLPQPSHHLPLATPGPVRSRVQLRATEAFHQAPQRLANILENKCAIAPFYISTPAQKHFYSDSKTHTLIPRARCCSQWAGVRAWASESSFSLSLW